MPGPTRTHPYLAGELILTFLAAGWGGLGLYYGLSHSTATPTGNVFVAASRYLGSLQVLTGILLAIVVLDLGGLGGGIRWLRQTALAAGMLTWSFVAFGLATRTGGFTSTATFAYASFALLAAVTYRSLSNSRHSNNEQTELAEMRATIASLRHDLKVEAALRQRRG